MIAVIFEVWPAQKGRQAYFDRAAALRQALQAVEGFISVERFESLAETGKLLLLSFWRDEAAVKAWRCHASHRSTQAAGRAGILTTSDTARRAAVSGSWPSTSCVTPSRSVTA